MSTWEMPRFKKNLNFQIIRRNGWCKNAISQVRVKGINLYIYTKGEKQNRKRDGERTTRYIDRRLLHKLGRRPRHSDCAARHSRQSLLLAM